eukprot:UN28063
MSLLGDKKIQFVGVLGTPDSRKCVMEDFNKAGVGYKYSIVKDVPQSTSYIWRTNTTRTIVHYPSCPYLKASDFNRINLDNVSWIHFEGRNHLETIKMIEKINKISNYKIFISVEVERIRRDGDIEFLYNNVRIYNYFLSVRIMSKLGMFQKRPRL